MTVVLIEGGKVVLTLGDVKNVTEARKKYPHLVGAYLVNGNYVAGTLFANGNFTAPAATAPVAEDESPTILAIRDLADAAGPTVVAKIETRLGSRRT